MARNMTIEEVLEMRIKDVGIVNRRSARLPRFTFSVQGTGTEMGKSYFSLYPLSL